MTESDLQQLVCSRLDCPAAEKLGWPVVILHGNPTAPPSPSEPNRFATALACSLTGASSGDVMDSVYVVRKDGQPFSEAEFWTLFETMVRLADCFSSATVTEDIFLSFAARLRDQMARPLRERARPDNYDSDEEAAATAAAAAAAAPGAAGSPNAAAEGTAAVAVTPAPRGDRGAAAGSSAGGSTADAILSGGGSSRGAPAASGGGAGSPEPSGPLALLARAASGPGPQH